jgi:nicotinamidase/pyrazinamidase
MRVSSTDVLIVVDVQNDFCTRGALAVPGGEKIVPASTALPKNLKTLC